MEFQEPWEAFQAPTTQGQPQPLIARTPPPVRPGQERQEAVGTARTEQQITQSDTGGVNFENEEQLRDSYQANPAVRNYETIMPLFASASRAEDGGAGDLNIIYAFGKAMDPGSVVREGELQMTQNTGGMQEQINGWIQSLRTPGGRLPAGVRERLLREIRSRASSTGDAYRQIREDYRRRAERYGFDPDSVLGQNAGQPFQQAEADYLNRPVRNMDGTLGPVPSDQRPSEPGGALTFDDEARPPEDPAQRENVTFRDAFQQAVMSRRFRNVDDALSYARGLNPAIGSRLDRGEVQRAVEAARAGQRVVVTLPPEADTSPLITDARGGDTPVNPLGMTGALGISGQEIDAVGRGAADVLSVGLSDEIAAAGDTLFGRGGTYGENLYRQRGIDEYDRNENPGWRIGGQMAGALAIPTGVGRATFRGMRGAVGNYGGRLAGPARADAVYAGRRAGARRLGFEGTAYGGGYGFGSGEGDVGDRLTQGGLSAAFGGGAAYGLGRTMGAVAGRYGGRGEDGAGADQLRAARSAAELDIRMPRSVIGGEQAQRWATTVEKTPFGAAPVARGTETMINDSQGARDRIARGVGDVMEPEAIGDMAIRGGDAVRSRTSDAGSRLYDEAERLTGETRVPLPSAAAELDGQIAELADTPGVVPAILSTLQGVRSRLDGDWTPASIRRMKSQLERQFGEAGMRPSDASRRARLITEAAENDMVAGLTERGQADAAQGWRAASNNWRERQTMLEHVVEPILGRNNERTPEDVTRALLANARGNGTRLGSFLRELPAENAGTIRASIINQLGRSPPGQQNAAGEAFSLDTFLTHWNQIKGARHQIFSRETVGALNHLANVADRARFAGRARNLSNTGTPMMATVTASPLIAGATALAMGSPKAAVAATLMSGFAALAQNRAGALLASPKFARRLANAPDSPAASRRFWSGPWVAQLASSEPTIANDLLGFQQAALRQLGAAPSAATRAAAEQEE